MAEIGVHLVKPANGTLDTYTDILTLGMYTSFDDFLPTGMVLDVGAGYGDYAVLAAKKYGVSVIAFEPLPENFSVLSENTTVNGLQDLIKIRNVAVGDLNGPTSISFSGGMARVDGKSTLQIGSVTIDSLELDPALIKIDVEGMELKVLVGAKKTLARVHPKVIIETHSKSLRKQVELFMNELGYSCVHTNFKFRGEGEMNEKMNRFYLVKE